MTINYLERFWIKYLPDYIDRKYPKGNELRGEAVVIITLFMVDLAKTLKQIKK